LNQRVFATGHTAITVPGSGSLTTVNVAVAGISKANDKVLVTLDRNAQTTVAPTGLPYVYQITDGASFDVGLNLENADPSDKTCFLNWAVLR
jgi:hypothetical protein